MNSNIHIFYYIYKNSTKLCFFQVKLNVPFCWIQPVEPTVGPPVPPTTFVTSGLCRSPELCRWLPLVCLSFVFCTAAARQHSIHSRQKDFRSCADTCHRAPRRTTKGWAKLSAQSLQHCSPLAARRLTAPVPRVLLLFCLSTTHCFSCSW